MRVLIIFSAVLLLFVSCGEREAIKSHSGKIRIVCTTGMITDIVREIAGSEAEVYGLMGPGVDPHLYKATPRDVEALFVADIIFYNGCISKLKWTNCSIR